MYKKQFLCIYVLSINTYVFMFYPEEESFQPPAENTVEI